MGSLEDEQDQLEQHTFHGTDLVHSLGSVLSGAMPLLVNQSDTAEDCLAAEGDAANSEDNSPLGARIIRTVRAFDLLTENDAERMSARDAIDEMRSSGGFYDEEVLEVLESFKSTDPATLDSIAGEIDAPTAELAL
ncbi:MAG: hypothetical protein CMJ78_06940 [Planctomycetaceae bacterium]|nr:hypothetical protein [Planctomycetaceae bacterium]